MVVVPPLKPIVPVPLNVFGAPSVTFCVPPAKVRIAGEVALKVPVLVPPPERASVPPLEVTEPELLNCAETLAMPAPADFLKMPLLSMRRVGERSEVMASSAWMSNVPVAEFVTTALLTIEKGLATELRMMELLFVIVRPFNVIAPLVPVSDSAPAAGETVNEPEPVIVPPAHVTGDWMVRLPVPPSVPLLMLRFGEPENDVGVLTLSVPPATPIVPLPEKTPLLSNVPPVKLIVLAAVGTLTDPVDEPPPARFKGPEALFARVLLTLSTYA